MSKFVHLQDPIESIDVPPSKSFAQRALFAAALSHAPLSLENIGISDDVNHVLQIIQQLGCSVETTPTHINIAPRQTDIKPELNVGESGLGTRLTVPIVSTFSNQFIINGKGSLLNRPMTWFRQALPQMGLKITLQNQHLPITVNGQIKGGNYKVDGSFSSQYISGLLMALPLCDTDSVLVVENPTSIPYIDITLQILADFGIEISHSAYQEFTIKGKQNYAIQTGQYQVEGDFSSAAFWIVYGLINQGIRLKHLNPNSVQADCAILEVVKQVGGNYHWEDTDLIITSAPLHPFNFDASHCPDLFPILVVLAAAINGKSTIIGTHRLEHKESNRATVLLEEFSKLGLNIKSKDNVFTINGCSTLKSGNINSNNDHRIAMAGAIASFLTPHGIYISNPNCVNKSYPEFWNHYSQNT